MKKKLPCLIGILMGIFGPAFLFGQDARFYYEGTNYTGPYIDINLGQTVLVNSDGDAICIKILNPNVAVKATRVDGSWDSYPTGSINNYFVYTDQDMPYVGGTNQYENINIRVECIPKANTWQDLPQPLVYVPFDISNVNPNPDNDHFLKGFEPYAGRKILALRRAYFWENSEDVGGLHGPYADIKIGAYDPAIFSNSNWLNPDVAHIYAMPNWKSDLSGPIWSGYAPAFYPDPYDEWIDGPFGCIYSNIVVWDWGVSGLVSDNAQIGIIVSEADGTNPEDIMGGRTVLAGEQGLILVKVQPFGWVLLENIDINGLEERVSNADVYWFGGWNGQYPVSVYGPQNAAVPCETCPGNQFRPFTDSQFWSFHGNPAFDGYKVGLMGGNYPIGIYNRPRTYYAIDKPVSFGQ
jgi:hypothetical protein